MFGGGIEMMNGGRDGSGSAWNTPDARSRAISRGSTSAGS
jgi:hypothetical protein